MIKVIYIFLALVLVSCSSQVESGLAIGSAIVPGSGGGGPVVPTPDTVPPVISGTIDVSADDIHINNSPTLMWSTATDNDSGVDFYEVAVVADEGSSSCDATDFAGTLLLDWVKVPAAADFAGAGYQIFDAALDGDGAAISLQQNGSTEYCIGVRATDVAANTSDPIYSSVVSKFYYESCLEKKANEPTAVDGVVEIDVLGSGTPVNLYCDMTTQGGGWTLVVKYDSALATAANFSLPAEAGRSDINGSELTSINATANFAASVDMRPFVANGAAHIMHVGKTDDAATDSSTYVRHYFSDIYQSVIDDPNNLFNAAVDTNDPDAVSGTIVSGMSAVRKDQWYEADFTVMTQLDSSGSANRNYRIDGGEGAAMFTNGSRPGAVYSSGNSSNVVGHSNPKVQWGFRGKDNTQQNYGGNTYIGTYCGSSLSASSCRPESPINMMFVR